jgi:hypothetical protein
MVCGCGSESAPAGAPPVEAGKTGEAAGKAGDTSAKGASPNDLSVPAGSEAHFGGKMSGEGK